nr:patellin-3-like [Ipomoea batatas]GMD99640.1 patellin-3-like [Ipomoea batatas]
MAHEEAVQVEEVVVVPEVSSRPEKPLPANADSVPICIEEEDTSSEPSVQSQESQTDDGAKMVEAIAETIISVSTLEDAKPSVQSNTNPENQQLCNSRSRKQLFAPENHFAHDYQKQAMATAVNIGRFFFVDGDRS